MTPRRRPRSSARAAPRFTVPLPVGEVELPPRAVAALAVRRLRPADCGRGLAFSADGRELHAFAKDGAPSCFDAATGIPVARPRDPIEASAGPPTSPDGRLTVRTKPRFEVVRTDTAAAIWSDDDWHPAAAGVVFACDGSIVAFARDCLPAGKKRGVALPRNLFYLPHRPSLRLVDARTGQLVREVPGLTAPVAWLPASRLLAAVRRDKKRAIAFIEPETGRVVRSLPVDAPVRSIAFSPDGRRLAIGDSTGIRILDAETGAEVVSSSPACGLKVSPDGRWLAVLQGGGRVHLRDRRSGDPLGRVVEERQPISLAFGPTGAEVAVSRGDRIHRLDPATWEDLAPPVPNSEHAWIVAYLAADALVAATEDSVLIVDLPGGKVAGRIWHPEVETVEVYSVDRAPAKILDVAAAAGSELIAVAGQDAVRLWDWRSQAEAAQLPSSGDGLALSADGRCLAVASGSLIQLFDAARAPLSATLGEGRLQRSINAPAAIRGLAISPDAARVAAGVGRSIRLYDAATGESAGCLEGHAADVGVLFAPDGRTLFSADAEGAVFEWDVRP